MHTIAVVTPAISLAPSALPGYALRTTARMFVALAASLLFTFVYATAAAKSRRAAAVLIPLLDILQSVPILGYLSFTVLFFIALFPGNELGFEAAAVFAIFTSQAWNMTFSLYQSLLTVPRELDEASRALRFSGWQRFWRLEVPFAMPGLIWNMMMSMSGGWFFVVASEAISVGSTQIALPGIGSYVARAIDQRDLGAIGWAILAMAVVIILYDQLFFKPLVAWADKFRADETSAQETPRSWVLDFGRRAVALQSKGRPLPEPPLHRLARARMELPRSLQPWRSFSLPSRVVDVLWYGFVAACVGYIVWQLLQVAAGRLSWNDLAIVGADGGLTLARVALLMVLATVVWVPIGVMVGLRPQLASRIGPLAQFLAAFPANLLFPIAVSLIVRFHAAPAIWLTPLMILGTQWYILFNVIAGASAYPTELREAAATFRIRGWRWWRYVMLPGVFPYYVTGAITASGGAWNASIVSEIVNWGSTTLDGGGLGSYIARMTANGDVARVGLGVAMMSLLVVCVNRGLWRPLYAVAERSARLD